MDAAVLLSPVVAAGPVELSKSSRTLRKQVGRVGQINYKGQKLDFTPDFYRGLITAHEEGAFDACHLMFAGDTNAHTKAVGSVNGEIMWFELNGDRFDAIVKAANDDSYRKLVENPKIGVSMSIEQPAGEGRTDGRTWPAAIHHVLCTTDARMTGLSPWEPVELSRDTDAPVIDLSVLDFADDDPAPQAGDSTTTPGGVSAVDTPKETVMPDAPAPQLTDEEIARFREWLASNPAPTEQVETEPEPEFTEEELRQAARDFLGLTDQPDVTAETDEVDDEPTEEPVEDREPATVGLSWEAQRSIDLANSRADRVEIQLAKMTAERDEERFAALVKSWAEDYGIPPRITELAKPLLCGQAPAIELSNGDVADAGQIVRDVVTELAKARYLDLSSADTVYDQDAATKKAGEDADRDTWSRDYLKNNGLA